MIKPAPWYYLAIALAQAAHSIEEQLTGFYRLFPLTTAAMRERVAFVPVLDPGADGFAAMNMAVITLLLTLAPFVFQGKVWARRAAWLVACIELINGTGHISAALFTGTYVSGSVAGSGLIAFPLLYLTARRSQ
jgi:hypothetical protein